MKTLGILLTTALLVPLLAGPTAAYDVKVVNNSDCKQSVRVFQHWIVMVGNGPFKQVDANSTQVLADSSAWCPCSITITNGTCGQPTHTELIDLGYGLWTPKCWNSTVTISGDSKSGYSATWQ